MPGTEGHAAKSHAALFESLCDAYAGMSGVTVPEAGSGFGSNAIKINKSIFAHAGRRPVGREAPRRTGRGAHPCPVVMDRPLMPARASR